MKSKKPKNPVIKPTDKVIKKDNKSHRIEVTNENAPKLTVHFLQQIYGRLGYIIKLLEERGE